jgi:hypothetical protein
VRKFPVSIEREGQEFVLRADAVDAMGRFVGGLEGEVVVAGPDGGQRKLPLEKITAGRFEARWLADKAGAYHAQVAFTRDGETVDRQSLGVTAGYPLEFLPRAPDEDMLRALAETTGGELNPDAKTLWQDDRTATEERELWPWLASLALLLFLGDVALKRWQRPARSAAGLPPPHPSIVASPHEG